MADATEQVIRRLGADLQPVRRLPAPGWQTVFWLGLVAAIAIVLAVTANLPAVGRRLTGAPDMWLSATGSTLTAILAALAAFQLSLPDRSRNWALLPLPALLLWVACSGLGCLRTVFVAGIPPASLQQAIGDCLPSIVGLSLPLSAALLLMLRRARPLQPSLVAAMGGLAAAAASASLLCFSHPFDAGAVDLLVHGAGILLIVLAMRWSGTHVL